MEEVPSTIFPFHFLLDFVWGNFRCIPIHVHLSDKASYKNNFFTVTSSGCSCLP